MADYDALPSFAVAAEALRDVAGRVVGALSGVAGLAVLAAVLALVRLRAFPITG